METRPNRRVLDAARSVAETIHRLLRTTRGVVSARLLGRAATAMSANIAEGWRSSDVDREHLLANARASAVETIAHWRQAFAAEHLQPWVFWPIHHQLVMIVRMLDAVLAG